MSLNRSHVTLSDYVERRSGVPLGARGSLKGMLHQSLGAASFGGFWRYWNPLWGYYLGRYVHRPLRRFMPSALAVVATFVVSGAIHDAAVYLATGSTKFLFTLWFGVLGTMVVVGSRRGLRYEFRVWPMRALTNIALIGAAFAIARFGEQLLDLS